MSRFKKVMIVIEETGERQPGGDQPFNVYLAGDKERIGTVPKEQLSAAEFWGAELFRVVQGILVQSGALESVSKRGETH